MPGRRLRGAFAPSQRVDRAWRPRHLTPWRQLHTSPEPRRWKRWNSSLQRTPIKHQIVYRILTSPLGSNTSTNIMSVSNPLGTSIGTATIQPARGSHRLFSSKRSLQIGLVPIRLPSSRTAPTARSTASSLVILQLHYSTILYCKSVDQSIIIQFFKICDVFFC